MINEKSKKYIIDTLGQKYSQKILQHLDSKGLKNNHGNPYTREYLYVLINGTIENPDLELEIIEFCYHETLKKEEKKKLLPSFD